MSNPSRNRRSCEACGDKLAALREGTLHVAERFRLGDHIRGCLDCKLLLLILLEDAERHGGPGACHVKALGVRVDVDTTRMSDWLFAMFPTREVHGAR